MHNRITAEVIGTIKWFGRFRGYCLFPEPETVWSKSCNEEVNKFLDKVNSEHREDLKKQKLERKEKQGV